MMQLPVAPPQGVSPIKSIQGNSRPEVSSDVGFSNLLDADFAQVEELSAIVPQMPPEMLAMLQQQLDSGMSLPQAARSVLLSMQNQSAALSGLMPETLADVMSDLDLKLDSLLPTKTGIDVDAFVKRIMSSPENDLGKALKNLVSATGQNFDQSAEHGEHRALGNLGAVTTNTQSTFSSSLSNHLLGMGVPQKVGTPEWGSAVGDRVVWMLKGDTHMATLKLNPAGLGMLEVNVSLDKDQASVAFLAQTAAAKEALEAALPRLKDMLEDQGIDLADVNVGQHEAQAEQSGEESEQNSSTDSNGGTLQESDDTQTQVLAAKLGLVDEFA